MRTVILAVLFILAVTSFATAATRVAVAPVKFAPIGGVQHWGGNVPAFAEERIYCVAPEVGRRFGVEIVERAGLDMIRAEQSLRSDPMFDASTFPEEGQGQGASAQILTTVTRCSLERHHTNFAFGGGATRVRIDQETVTATVWVQARIVGVGLIKISNTAEGRATATKLFRDRSGIGRYRPENYGDWGGACHDDAEAGALTEAADKAIISMLQRLLPAVNGTSAMREGWKFDPSTGQPIGSLHCSRCGKELPDGARFCPYDGVPVERQNPYGNVRPAAD